MTIGRQFDPDGKTLQDHWEESRSLKPKIEASASACFCVGPQNGEPLCPCQMRGLVKKDGRWVRPEQDFGPSPAIP